MSEMKVVAEVLLYPESEAECTMLKSKVRRFVNRYEVKTLRHIKVGTEKFAEVDYNNRIYYVPLTYEISKIIKEMSKMSETPTDRIRKFKRLTSKLEVALTNFVYDILKYYNIPVYIKRNIYEITGVPKYNIEKYEEEYETVKLKVKVTGEIGKFDVGGTFNQKELTIEYGTMTSLYIILHEIAHYIDYSNDIKSERKEIKEVWFKKEKDAPEAWFKEELKASEFASTEWSKWKDKYMKELYSVILEHTKAIW